MSYFCTNCSHHWTRSIPKGVPAGHCTCPNCGCFSGQASHGVQKPLVDHLLPTFDPDLDGPQYIRPNPFRKRERPQYWCALSPSQRWASGLGMVGG